MLIWQSRGQASISQAMKARPGVGVNGLYGYPSAKAVTAAWMNSSGTAPTSSTPGRGMAVKGVPSAAGQPVNHRPLSAASVWLDTPGTQEQHEPVNTGLTMIIKTFRVDLTSASAV